MIILTRIKIEFSTFIGMKKYLHLFNFFIIKISNIRYFPFEACNFMLEQTQFIYHLQISQDLLVIMELTFIFCLRLLP